MDGWTNIERRKEFSTVIESPLGKLIAMIAHSLLHFKIFHVLLFTQKCPTMASDQSNLIDKNIIIMIMYMTFHGDIISQMNCLYWSGFIKLELINIPRADKVEKMGRNGINLKQRIELIFAALYFLVKFCDNRH